jgi:hypothetical protein
MSPALAPEALGVLVILVPVCPGMPLGGVPSTEGETPWPCKRS